MYDVIVSGGGPVGLGLAIELGQRGLQVAVVERNVEIPQIPKGQNLTQRTMEHMQAWGVEPEIRAAKTIPDGYGIGGLTAYGTLLSGYHYDWFKRASVDRFYNARNERLPQYKTEAILRGRVGELPTVELFEGWVAGEIEQDDDKVSIRITQGQGERELQASFLVGCDGSRSHIRKSAGISETCEDHDRLMALVVFESPAFFEILECFPNKQFYNVLHPDNDGYWMFFGMVNWGNSFFFHAPVSASARGDDFDFKALITRAVGVPFDMDLTYVGFWDLRIALADTYRNGRIFIAGDAAHSHPPYGGYGINTGFEDARNLGWKLAAVLQGWGGPALLDSYEAERRPVFESTARDFIDRFIRDDRAFVRNHAPDTDLAKFEAAWTKRSAGGDTDGIAAFAPHYEGSKLVTGGGSGPPSASGHHLFDVMPGHHMPPFPARDGGSVLDHLGSRLSLVTSAASGEPSFGSPGHAHLTLIRSDDPALTPQFTILRPDGYVAGCCSDPAEIPNICRASEGYS